MALCVNQIGILSGIAISGVLSVKLRIAQGHIIAAVSAFAVLLAPFQRFEFATKAWLASLKASTRYLVDIWPKS